MTQSTVYRAVQILCVMLLSGVAQAQEGGDTAASDQRTASRAEAAKTRVDEEVVVTGERTLRNLVARAERFTLDFYDMLNAAIDDPEFRINCQRERLADSNIRRRVCRPRYIEAEQARQASEVFRRIPLNEDGEKEVVATDRNQVQSMMLYDLGQTAIMQKQQEFNDRILRAVNEDAALNRAFWELYGLKAEIDELRGSE